MLADSPVGLVGGAGTEQGGGAGAYPLRTDGGLAPGLLSGRVKEVQVSVLERFVGPSTYRQHGERVVAGQRLMQAATDIFLGWQRIKGLDGVTRDYHVRQFHDWKGGAEVGRLLPPGAAFYARLCGATLARAHARWGDRIAGSIKPRSTTLAWLNPRRRADGRPDR